MKNTEKNDIRIIKALYYGTHLEPDELERASKLLYGLRKEFAGR